MQQEETPIPKKPNRKIWIILTTVVAAIACVCVGVVGVIRFSSDWRERQYVGKPTPVPEKAYVELRTAALNRKASELGLNIDSSSNQPYGIVMDWNIGTGTSTIVSFATGDASMYYSTGGGWLGGISVDQVMWIVTL